jgi:imidazolonepropionase-like amidohydrolase
MYEKGAWAARVAYSWRSEYLVTALDCCVALPVWQDAAGFLDASLRFQINDNLELNLQGSNLLNTKTVLLQQVDNDGLLKDYSWFQNDRRLQFGMQISVTMLSMTGGHNDPWLPGGVPSVFGVEYPGMPSGVCDGVDGVSAKVREVIRAGADFIKIASSGGFLSPADDPLEPNYSQEEVDAIVRTAADLGTWVMSHAHGSEGIKRAVRAGVRSIDHGTYLDEEAAEMMVERGTWLVPTLTAGDTTEALAHDEKVPAAVREKLGGLGRPEFGAMRLAAEAGVKVAMGTDCPVAPHGTNLNELRHMAANGFTPAQSLQAATSSAAALMGLADELGSIESGKRADLVVLRGEALEFDDYEARIEQVWKDGTRVVPFDVTG